MPAKMGNTNSKKYNIDKSILLELREQGLNFQQIGKKLGFKRELIRYHMNKMGFYNNPDNYIKEYKNNFNRDYFEKIDTEDKAYFLGLMYADGCTKNYSAILGLTDPELIFAFKDALEADIRITTTDRGHYKTIYSIDITSKKIVNDLINLGCVSAKSLILKFPTEEQIPKELLHHFIRGYFDGDGSIMIRKMKQTGAYHGTATIVGTEHFVLGLGDFFSEKGINTKYQKYKNVYVLRIDKIHSIVKLYKLFYEKSNIFLNRKKDKFKEFFKYRKENHLNISFRVKIEELDIEEDIED